MVTILVAAIGLLVASVIVPAPSTQLVRRQVFGPISTTIFSPNTFKVGTGSEHENSSHAVQLQLAFRIDQLIPGETLFHVGAATSGISAVVSTPDYGNDSVLLKSVDPSQPFSAVLVNHVVVGRQYSISISVPNGHAVSASSDGRLQFSYSHLDSDLLPRLASATVGSSPLGVPLHGTVSNFGMTVDTYRGMGSATLVITLRGIAGLLVGILIVLCVVRFATGRKVASWLRLPSDGDDKVTPNEGFLLRHLTLIGFLLLAAAIATLTVVTPIDNAVLQKSGTQYFSAAPVGPRGMSHYALAGETRLFANAAAVDVDLTFQIERTAIKPSATPFVVSTFGDNHGLMFQVVEINGLWQLISFVGGQAPILQTTQRTLIPELPLNQTFLVNAVIERSQSFRYYVYGLPVQSFTWNLPILRASPAAMSINGTFGGVISHLKMTVTTYRVDPSRVSFFLIRTSQLLALLGVIASAIILLRRYLSKLIPRARPRKPLVLVTFWTMGVGILLNVVVDLFHFQQSNNLYVNRNSWLLSQYPRFNDFFQIYELLRSFNPYGIQGGNYPPFGYWIAAPFLWMSEYAALIVMIGLTVGFISWWSYRCFTSGLSTLGRVLVVAVVLFSLPVSIAVDRANEDLILFIFVVLGVAALERLRPAVAAWWFGLAAAAKIYPALYLMVFLRGRRLRYIFLSLLIAVTLTFLSVATYRGTLINNLDAFRPAYSAMQTHTQVGGIDATYYNASIPAWLQSIGYWIGGGAGLQAVRTAILPAILPAEVLVGIALAGYLRWREQSLWRAVTLITTFVLLFSDLSYYYELLFLFVPLALFVKYAEVTRNGLIIAVLFGLSMAPRAYFYFGDTMIDVSVVTTAPLLIGLSIAVLYDGYRSRAILRAKTDVELSLTESLDLSEI